MSSGSSPQARGTPILALLPCACRRFIPAGAGNTDATHRLFIQLSVHPRRRGEHSVGRAADLYSAGSSPQARGTLIAEDVQDGLRRFIPAGAGNTVAGVAQAAGPAVHPRRRGEHVPIPSGRFIMTGSSPQARGTHYPSTPGVDDVRFIPAGAGNTAAPTSGVPTSAVHPRRRGEHFSRERWVPGAPGSSPQARGTLCRLSAYTSTCRFIPAGAGNTRWPIGSDAYLAVHPRRRGEHSRSPYGCRSCCGSSPQARGTLEADSGEHVVTRFIPAGAGNTAYRHWPCAGSVAVHPRRRGEHSNHTRLISKGNIEPIFSTGQNAIFR